MVAAHAALYDRSVEVYLNTIRPGIAHLGLTSHDANSKHCQQHKNPQTAHITLLSVACMFHGY
jgi:hypothetical protein